MLLLRPGGATQSIDSPVDIASVARIVRRDRRCILFARDGVTVNGLPPLPIQVLRDRDEIRAAGQTIYFTADAIPQESILRTSMPLRCARCLGGLAEGDRVVRCPRCLAHHHPCCWHGAGCLKCLHPAASLAWTPEPL